MCAIKILARRVSEGIYEGTLANASGDAISRLSRANAIAVGGARRNKPAVDIELELKASDGSHDAIAVGNTIIDSAVEIRGRDDSMPISEDKWQRTSSMVRHRAMRSQQFRRSPRRG